ncbi:DM13 domain-containing protein [Jiella mangrovi]|uniref:DM13 domain-containing protein n=1 Tax=Jiella mangrovi TaxID=2821407 RepID=A0ABS4BL40_9HYPH|nr:DM13 domain-containing protein [Jiella mangrovi]MBP0617438.1 DM13 domain-containing protein [Jiella mangrovi]
MVSTFRHRLSRTAAAGVIATFIVGSGAGASFAETLKSGRFAGASGHAVSGSVIIEREGNRTVLRFGPDFSFDGAPDPKIALGKAGYDPATLMGPLKADNGGQSYDVPARLDVAAYDEVWIWCEEFAVPLAMAKIE